ncbi:hypothetical protein GGF50DRAFT_119419 [Schizophyllum commune]
MGTEKTLSVLLCEQCSHEYVVPDTAPPSALEKLRNHWLPDVDEAEIIRVEASATRMSVSAIEKEVANLIHKVKQMQGLQAVLVNTLNAQEALVAPIRRLPVEVLQPIFVFACEDNGSDCMERWPTALVLSSVSKYYRDVALSTPEIWARVPVESMQILAGEWPPASRSLIVRRLRLYLSRISNASLPNAVRFPTTLSCYSPTTIINSIALQYSNAWTDLKITGYGFFSVLGDRTLNRLERLHTDVGFLLTSSGERDKSAVFERAFRLRHLEITNFTNVNVQKLSFPWAQITTLKTRCSDAFAIDALAVHCTQLVSWSHSSTSRSFSQGRSPTSRIVFEHLRHLVVESINVRDTRHAWHFDRLTAPRLETLSVNWPYSPDVNGGSIGPFLTRSGCKLRSMSLKRPSVLEWVFVASSHRIPHKIFIDRVSLSAIDAPSDAASGAASEATVFAPLLKMTLRCFGTLEGQFLIDLVTREDGCRAGRLEVTMCEERSVMRVSEEEMEKLERLLPHGVSIRKVHRMLYEADED